MTRTGRQSKHGVSLRTVVICIFLAGLVISGLALFATSQVTQQYRDTALATDRYLLTQNDLFIVRDIMNELNERARSFVIVGDIKEAVKYYKETQVQHAKDKAVKELEDYLADSSALRHLQTAVDLSDQLAAMQVYAMRLAVEGHKISASAVPSALLSVELDREDTLLSGDEQLEKALNLLSSSAYSELNNQLDIRISLCKEALVETMENRHRESSSRLQRYLLVQRMLSIAMVGFLLLFMIYVLLRVINPIHKLVREIQKVGKVSPYGSSEIRFLGETYNRIYQRMENANAQLSYEASHDALTGLYNRNSYETMRTEYDGQAIGLLLVDVDHFKSVNDAFGHDIGDKVLVRVARVLRDSFRGADKVFRIGGDEFAVVMIGITSDKSPLVLNRVSAASRLLGTAEGEVPAVTISAGCAFSDQLRPEEDLFKNADRALYSVKESGRGSCAFHSEKPADSQSS